MTSPVSTAPLVVPLSDVSRSDLGRVGGKNASLGELQRHLADAGVRVPEGFAVTADAYRALLATGGLEERIAAELDRWHAGTPLAEVGARIREAFAQTPLPPSVEAEVRAAYRRLCGPDGGDVTVAVRSSATAEDLPEASFAGQQESFLNVTGEDDLLTACRRCFASLFTDRAISYRADQGFGSAAVALSVGVQRMVRSDLAGAGVVFTLDTESGFPHVTLVTAAWGLGETVVGGSTDPDEHLVFTPLLDVPDVVPVLSQRCGHKQVKAVYAPGVRGGTVVVDTPEDERQRFVLDRGEVLQLARWAHAVERHYGTPMDVEWAKDGLTGELFVVQARPETVQANRRSAPLRTFRLTGLGATLLSGMAVGDAVASGPVCRILDAADLARMPDGAVLVTTTTDPDWEPVMKRAAAIVTDSGGRTSHAAIVSRELGLPAVVGTGAGTSTLVDGQLVTVCCTEGDVGRVLEGRVPYEVTEVGLDDVPATRTKVMLNLADPAAAFRWWRLPADGVGLLRTEFLVSNHVGVHPMALAHPELLDDDTRRRVLELTAGYDDPADLLVDRLSEGVARIAASRWPDPVVVRTSDFKTNEYARLLGGEAFEPQEENPMIGWRGASRYYDDGYRDGFALECRALRRVREELGLTNVVVLIPFCRTLGEADRVLATMAEHGMTRGYEGLEVEVMAEIPANVVLAEEFAERFDGFSVGSNDLTQLTLGVDRDSARLAHLFDERDPAVLRSIRSLITRAHAAGRTVGLCGQRPSDDPDFARLLVDAGIDSVSVTPDSFLAVKRNIAAAERAVPAARSGEPVLTPG